MIDRYDLRFPTEDDHAVMRKTHATERNPGEWCRWSDHVEETCRMRDKILELCAACKTCHGTGCVTLSGHAADGSHDDLIDDCPDCFDFRELVT
jgi:hypothetical protein